MIVLVTGSRDIQMGSAAAEIVIKTLTTYQATDDAFGIQVVVHGGARGADRVAATWARTRGISTELFEAQWDLHGPAAGPRRNQEMIDFCRRHRDEDGDRVLVCAFPKLGGGSAGTADCVRRAVLAGFQCFVAPVPLQEER